MFLSLVSLLSAAPSARADEPAPAPRMRLELAGAAELRARHAFDAPRELVPATRLDLGIRLGASLEVTAGMRHAFIADDSDHNEDTIDYDEVSLGLRYARPFDGVELFVEPQLVCSLFAIEDGSDGTYRGTTLGGALRAGVDLPLSRSFALGAALDASLSSEDWRGANVYYGLDVHVAARF